MCVASARRTRTGENPDGPSGPRGRFRRSPSHLPGPKAPLADQIRSLKGLARQSGRLHRNVCRALGDLILEDRLTEQEILERIIRARGPTASSSLLLFALSTESHRVQNTLFLSYHCGWPPTNEPTSAYSVLEGIWRGFHYGVLQEDPAVRGKVHSFLRRKAVNWGALRLERSLRSCWLCGGH